MDIESLHFDAEQSRRVLYALKPCIPLPHPPPCSKMGRNGRAHGHPWLETAWTVSMAISKFREKEIQTECSWFSRGKLIDTEV